MKILPNGQVEIENFDTGEKKAVSPQELPNYGIDTKAYENMRSAVPYQPSGSTPTGTLPAIKDSRPPLDSLTYKADTGTDDLSSQISAIEKARQNDYLQFPDKQSEINAFYDSQVKALDPTGTRLKEETNKLTASADQQKAIALKDKMLGELKVKAQTVKDVIAAGQRGDLTGEQYKTALNQASSAFNQQALFAKEDKVAGSALTGVELSILGGGIINQSSKTQSWLDKLTGNVPAPKSKVEEKEDTINQKMDSIISGKPISMNTDQGSKKSDFLPQLAKNAGQNAKDIANGVLNTPKAILDYANEKTAMGRPLTAMGMISDAAISTGKGLVNEYNNFLGRPLEGGDVVGRIGQRAYEKPVSTVLDVLPIISAVKNMNAAKGVTATNAEPSLFNKAKTGLQEKSATSFSVIDPNDVARSEQLASDALKMTKSLTKRGISKELDTFVPQAGKAIDEIVDMNDKVIGPQPVDQILGDIRSRLESTAVGAANPNLVDTQMRLLQGRLETQSMGNLGAGKGELYGTTLKNLNETRKLQNSSIPNNWFETKPTVSLTDNLSHLRWETSKALKDIIAEADNTGTIKDLINKQHVALEVKPVLAREALAPTGVSNGIFRNIMNMFNKATEPIKTAGARALQGKGYSLPEITPGPVPEVPSAIKTASMVRKPLPTEIVNNMISKKGGSQAVRIMNDFDLSTTPGEQLTRAAQENVLRAAAKRKYK